MKSGLQPVPAVEVDDVDFEFGSLRQNTSLDLHKRPCTWVHVSAQPTPARAKIKRTPR